MVGEHIGGPGPQSLESLFAEFLRQQSGPMGQQGQQTRFLPGTKLPFYQE